MGNKKGTVYWFTGISGVGKTTIGGKFYNHLRRVKKATIFLDGDAMRDILGPNIGYSLSNRRKIARSYSRLCKACSDQGIDVVCATISLFHECHTWNRKNITKYKEIYIDAPIEVLLKRDIKNIYANAFKGKTKNVIGVNLTVEKPTHPDFVINNDGTRSVKEILSKLIKDLRIKHEN